MIYAISKYKKYCQEQPDALSSFPKYSDNKRNNPHSTCNHERPPGEPVCITELIKRGKKYRKSRNMLNQEMVYKSGRWMGSHRKDKRYKHYCNEKIKYSTLFTSLTNNK